MTTKDEALKQALDALHARISGSGRATEAEYKAAMACREALAQKDEDEPLPIPRTPHDIRNFLMANFCAAKFAKEDGEPDYDDVYEVTAHDLLEAFDNWEYFDCFQPTRKPRLTDEEIIWMVPGLIDSLNDPYEQVGGDPVSSIKIDMVKLVRAVEAYYRTGVAK